MDGQASGLWKLLETFLELLTVPSSAGNALFKTDYPGGDAAEWSSNPSPPEFRLSTPWIADRGLSSVGPSQELWRV